MVYRLHGLPLQRLSDSEQCSPTYFFANWTYSICHKRSSPDETCVGHIVSTRNDLLSIFSPQISRLYHSVGNHPAQTGLFRALQPLRSAATACWAAISTFFQVRKHTLERLPKFLNVRIADRIHHFCIKIEIMMAKHIPHPHNPLPFDLWIT